MALPTNLGFDYTGDEYAGLNPFKSSASRLSYDENRMLARNEAQRKQITDLVAKNPTSPMAGLLTLFGGLKERESVDRLRGIRENEYTKERQRQEQVEKEKGVALEEAWRKSRFNEEVMREGYAKFGPGVTREELLEIQKGFDAGKVRAKEREQFPKEEKYHYSKQEKRTKRHKGELDQFFKRGGVSGPKALQEFLANQGVPTSKLFEVFGDDLTGLKDVLKGIRSSEEFKLWNRDTAQTRASEELFKELRAYGFRFDPDKGSDKEFLKGLFGDDTDDPSQKKKNIATFVEHQFPGIDKAGKESVTRALERYNSTILEFQQRPELKDSGQPVSNWKELLNGYINDKGTYLDRLKAFKPKSKTDPLNIRRDDLKQWLSRLSPKVAQQVIKDLKKSDPSLNTDQILADLSKTTKSFNDKFKGLDKYNLDQVPATQGPVTSGTQTQSDPRLNIPYEGDVGIGGYGTNKPYVSDPAVSPDIKGFQAEKPKMDMMTSDTLPVITGKQGETATDPNVARSQHIAGAETDLNAPSVATGGFTSRRDAPLGDDSDQNALAKGITKGGKSLKNIDVAKQGQQLLDSLSKADDLFVKGLSKGGDSLMNLARKGKHKLSGVLKDLNSLKSKATKRMRNEIKAVHNRLSKAIQKGGAGLDKAVTQAQSQLNDIMKRFNPAEMKFDVGDGSKMLELDPSQRMDKRKDQQELDDLLNQSIPLQDQINEERERNMPDGNLRLEMNAPNENTIDRPIVNLPELNPAGGMGGPQDVDAAIQRGFADSGVEVDQDFMDALLGAESNKDRFAIGKELEPVPGSLDKLRHKKGGAEQSFGVGQVTPGTAAGTPFGEQFLIDNGRNLTREDLFNPEINAKVSVQFVEQLKQSLRNNKFYNSLGDLEKKLVLGAAYNFKGEGLNAWLNKKKFKSFSQFKRALPDLQTRKLIDRMKKRLAPIDKSGMYPPPKPSGLPTTRLYPDPRDIHTDVQVPSMGG